ncbi:MAG TPA: hypothetical protein VM120_10750 [Bryobacteraceae bacterium]|nr:hypothetical protein [Bryobacteraceae bacterium]
MPIYTCLDMIHDCRANKTEGWSYLITSYVPAIRNLLAHYYAGRANDLQLIDRVLKALRNPDSALYVAPGPATERDFVAMLRQEVVRVVEKDKASVPPEVPLDLEILTTALEPFTVTEKQFVWLEGMAYSTEATAKLMNLEPGTIQKVRDRAEDALRSHLDHWKRGSVADNGLLLGRLATAAETKDCLPGKAYLDAIDGRITWSRKKDYDYHLSKCWFCIDHFCRMREADFSLQKAKPMTAEESKPFRILLGLGEEKPSIWRRVLGN